MAVRSRNSLLHLQMGQEVIYLIFTVSLMVAFLLAIYAIHLERRLTPLEEAVAAAAEEPAPSSPETDPESLEPLKPDPDPGIALQAEPDPARDLPPILTLTEAEGYFFELGSAALAPSFLDKLEAEVAPRLAESARRFRVDIIEVIGHTDEVPVRLQPSSLDRELLSYLQGFADEEALVVADNVGLGMARAAAVARVLIADPRLAAYEILPLSAGQTIDLGQQLAEGGAASDVRERRRIEVRMRRRQ